MSSPTVVIIGGGLVGSVCANFMGLRGFRVLLYEKRDDPRTATLIQGRSINLALSHRGRNALKSIHLEDAVLQNAVPMKGRLIHSSNGSNKSILYDPKSNQCIYSVSRNFLNKTLLEAVEKYPNVKLYFNHKLASCDFPKGTCAIFDLKTHQSFDVKADLFIGADGAFSNLRRSMQQLPLFQFSQTYIEHGYLELSVPSSRGDQMVPNHLHIWPRGKFMMIALPNVDKSWTVTLFMPFAIFNSLTDKETLLEFFKRIFPDACSLIGTEELLRDFFKTKPSPLVCIKCKPYNCNSRFLLIGDAAHAMVPFYGQGMNAGFEDCSLLASLLDKHQNNVAKTLSEFSEQRVGDAHAICDLAMYNYVEMRDLVERGTYKVRKFFDDTLYNFLGDQWVPLYNSVTFSHMRYRECIENRNFQNGVLKALGIIVCASILIAVLSAMFYVVSRSG